MAPLRRRWRVAKWAGVGASLFLLLAWTASLAFYLAYSWGEEMSIESVLPGLGGYSGPPPGWSRECVFSDGLICCTQITFYKAQGWQADRIPWSDWSPCWRASCRIGQYSDPLTSKRDWDVELPLWIPFLLVAIPTGVLFWLDRRRIPPHCCQGCGYDLTGNTSGTCPECGTTV